MVYSLYYQFLLTYIPVTALRSSQKLTSIETQVDTYPISITLFTLGSTYTT